MMKIVILGGGVAGFTAAETIRKNDKCCEINIISGEPVLPYYRPRLVDVLAKKTGIENIFLKTEQWYRDSGINISINKIITGIDTKNKKILLENGEQAEYDKLVIALGSSPFKPPIPGIEDKNVFVLRTYNDVEQILECADPGKNAVILGGGLLGLETASSLINLGVKPVVLELYKYLLPRQMDEEGAEFLLTILKAKGIEFSMGAGVETIKREGSSLKVNLKNNGLISTDFIVVSSGVRSNTGILKEAGIVTGKGVIVDDRMRTNVPDVYAAGDICEHRSKLYGIWAAARDQAIAAGENIAGKDKVYNGSLFSAKLKVSGIDLVSMGDISGSQCQQYKALDEKRGIYKKMFVRNKLICGAIFLGDLKDSLQVQKMIKEKTDVSGREQSILFGNN